MPSPMQDAHDWLRKTAKQMQDDIEKGAAPNVEKLTVREFLEKFGYSKRGSWIVPHIRNTMEKLNLRTQPDFEYVYIDSEISIRLNSELTDAQSPEESADPIHQIGTLKSANEEPVSVKPDHGISAAVTLMQYHDYSQLPVMTGERDVKGIISWKSIGASLALGRQCEYVRQCMDQAEVIPITAPLFDAIGTISVHGYVLVQDANRVITGIVTASDLSNQFRGLAGPFLLIGEIEGHLRQLIHRKFTVEQMQAASTPSEGGRQVEGSADLTLGGYHQLLSNKANWDKLELNIDRTQFAKQLDDVRKIRNDVMHFDPDGLSSTEADTLRNFARFLRNLVRLGVV